MTKCSVCGLVALSPRDTCRRCGNPLSSSANVAPSPNPTSSPGASPHPVPAARTGKPPPKPAVAFTSAFVSIAVALLIGTCAARDRIQPTHEFTAQITSCRGLISKKGSTTYALEIDKSPYEVRFHHRLGAPNSIRSGVEQACHARARAVFTTQLQKPLLADAVEWVVALKDARTGEHYFTLEQSQAADKSDRVFAIPVTIFFTALGGMFAFAGVKTRRKIERPGAGQPTASGPSYQRD